MEIRPVCLDAADEVELGETLEALNDWLRTKGVVLAGSLRRFFAVDDYDIDGLGADMARFAFVLGANDDGGVLFGDER